MAGPLLEVFRFALYLSLPLGAMIHYGKPEWYTRNVLPVSIMGLSTSVVLLSFLPFIISSTKREYFRR